MKCRSEKKLWIPARSSLLTDGDVKKATLGHRRLCVPFGIRKRVLWRASHGCHSSEFAEVPPHSQGQVRGIAGAISPRVGVAPPGVRCRGQHRRVQSHAGSPASANLVSSAFARKTFYQSCFHELRRASLAELSRPQPLPPAGPRRCLALP